MHKTLSFFVIGSLLLGGIAFQANSSHALSLQAQNEANLDINTHTNARARMDMDVNAGVDAYQYEYQDAAPTQDAAPQNETKPARAYETDPYMLNFSGYVFTDAKSEENRPFYVDAAYRVHTAVAWGADKLIIRPASWVISLFDSTEASVETNIEANVDSR